MNEAPPDTGPLYVKRGDTVNGPFARRVVLHRLVLGSVRPDDQLSPDGMQWHPASRYREEAERSLANQPAPEPAPEPGDDDWNEERRAARLRWIDERSGRDRRGGPPPPGFPPRGPDRRGQPAPRQALFAPARENRKVRWIAPLAAILLVVATIAVMRWWLPSTSPSISLLPKDSQPVR